MVAATTTRLSFRVLFLLPAALALGALSAQAQVPVSAPEIACTPGDTLFAPIVVGNLTGHDITSYEIALRLDKTIARVIGTSRTSTLSSSLQVLFNPDPKSDPTTVRIAAAGTNSLSGSGTLLDLRVVCDAEGTTPLEFHEFALRTDPLIPPGTQVVPSTLVHGSIGVALAAPVAEVSVSALNLGDVILGREVTGQFSIANTGTGTLSGMARIIGQDAEAFAFHEFDGSFALSSGQSLPVTVVLSSTIVGPKFAQIEITHDSDLVDSPIVFDVSGEVLLNVGTEAQGELPGDFRLEQNYPNPFNPATSVSFGLPASGSVRISVFDVTGRERQVITDGVFSAGWHTVSFEAAGLSSGTYIYRLQADGQTVARTMTVLK